MFGNFRFSESGRSEFSVRLLKYNPAYSLFIGGAIDSTSYGNLNSVGWCLDAYNFSPYAMGSSYHIGVQQARAGQVVTVRVDVARKQIIYVVDGVPAGPRHTMKISDADRLRLRPPVQIWLQGDSVEIA